MAQSGVPIAAAVALSLSSQAAPPASDTKQNQYINASTQGAALAIPAAAAPNPVSVTIPLAQELRTYITSGDFSALIAKIITKKISAALLIHELSHLLHQTKHPKNWLQLFVELTKLAPQHFSHENISFLLDRTLSTNEKRPELCIQLIATGLKHYKDKTIPLLAIKVKQASHIVDALDFIPDAGDYFRTLVFLAIEKYNVVLLKALQTSYPNATDFVFAELTTAQSQLALQLLAMNQEQSDNLSTRIREFNHGFGCISMQGALLTCSQIQARKKYAFNPIIISGEEALEFFFELSTRKSPLRERIIVTSVHWVSADIQIDEAGSVSLLLIDAMGGTEVNNLFSTTAQIMQDFATYFPKGVIYFPPVKRQNAPAACQTFALDDLQHLYTAEKYLPAEYKHTGLFGFLKQFDAAKNHSADLTRGITFVKCQLPLSLQRTQHSRSFFADITARDEAQRNLAVSKKGWTAAQHAAVDFVEDKASVGKPVNVRLARKLDKFASNNAQYLMQTELKTVQLSMQTFTFTHFKSKSRAHNDRNLVATAAANPAAAAVPAHASVPVPLQLIPVK